MRETLELRVDSDHSSDIFAIGEGCLLSSSGIRKVILSSKDPRLAAIQAKQAELRREGRALYFSWTYHRRYTQSELRAARLLTLNCGWSSALAGELAGTIYDTATACPVCGAGRRRLSPLRVHLGKVPRVKDIVRAGSGEWVVSEHFVDTCNAVGATGSAFSPIEFPRIPSGKAPRWFELTSVAPPVSMQCGTEFATGALPDPEIDGRYVCPLGDTVGFKRISEVRLSQREAPAMDIVPTREYVGSSGEWAVPSRELLISGRLYAALAAAGIRGLKVEIARLATESGVV